MFDAPAQRRRPPPPEGAGQPSTSRDRSDGERLSAQKAQASQAYEKDLTAVRQQLSQAWRARPRARASSRPRDRRSSGAAHRRSCRQSARPAWTAEQQAAAAESHTEDLEDLQREPPASGTGRERKPSRRPFARRRTRALAGRRSGFKEQRQQANRPGEPGAAGGHRPSQQMLQDRS